MDHLPTIDGNPPTPRLIRLIERWRVTWHGRRDARRRSADCNSAGTVPYLDSLRAQAEAGQQAVGTWLHQQVVPVDREAVRLLTVLEQYRREPAEPPTDMPPERAEQYVALRQKFPMARAIGFVPPESAWRMASFSLTEGFGGYLDAVARIELGQPARRIFRAPGQEHQERPAGRQRHQGLNGSLALAVDPMQILQQQHSRPCRGYPPDQGTYRVNDDPAA